MSKITSVLRVDLEGDCVCCERSNGNASVAIEREDDYVTLRLSAHEECVYATFDVGDLAAAFRILGV